MKHKIHLNDPQYLLVRKNLSIKKTFHTINHCDEATLAFPSPVLSIKPKIGRGKVSDKEKHQKQSKQYGRKHNTNAQEERI